LNRFKPVILFYHSAAENGAATGLEIQLLERDGGSESARGIGKREIG
jgi:hypothetical protein